MFWKNIWRFLKSLWERISHPKKSKKNNTVLDTASIELFGLNIKVSREVPLNGPPYELTVVVPRAELRRNNGGTNLEIILSSITIAHSPRFEREPKQEKPSAPKPVAA